MLNVVVQNVSLIEGMAGSMRVKNLVEPLLEKGLIKLSNLALINTHEKIKIGKNGIKDDIEYLYIGYRNPLNPKQIFDFYKSGKKFLKSKFKTGEQNILYNYGYPDIKNSLLLSYAKGLGYKIVLDIVEDNRLETNFSGFLGWLRKKSSIYLIQKTKDIASAVIVISEHLNEWMNVVVEKKIPVIHIPITVNFKYFPTTPVISDPSNLKIFYGGTFNLEKDAVDDLIQAFNIVAERHKNVSLILSGMSPIKSDMEKIKNMIKDNHKITYKGYLSTDEYYHMLTNCDIFCMPRKNSTFANAGFPFKLGEFLATGKAVIASRVGDVPNYLVDHENALLVTPDNTSELVEAITYFIANPIQVTTMGKKAKLTAQNHFSSDNLSKKLFEILNSL